MRIGWTKLPQAVDLCFLECLRDAVHLFRILHIGLVSRLLCSSVKSMTTSAAAGPEIRNPIVVHLSTKPLHFCHHSSSVFCWADLQPVGAKKHIYHRIYILILFYKIDTQEDAKKSQDGLVHLPFDVISARLSRQLPRWTPASETLSYRCTSTIFFCHWFRGRSGLWHRFWTLIFIVPETTIISFRTLPLCFPLPAFSWFSFNTTLIPAILCHCSFFNPLISGLKVSWSEFLIYASHHHCFQSLIIGLQYLLMNCKVIQFPYGFEFSRLSYSQFVQTFQDVIWWELFHWQ